MWWKYPFTRGKTVFVRCFLFQHSVVTNPTIFWTLLRSNAYEFVQDFCFSFQGKSRDIVFQRICLFLWLIFAQHGLFEIQLTVYSALSRLTDLGIYDITRCGIWLLTIFHIPYIHFQRELRKVTSPKWYLSFFVQYTCFRSIINLHAECTILHNCKCCALRGSLNLTAPNFKLCCLSLPQFYLKSHDTFYSLTQDRSYILAASSAHFGITFAYVWFWIPRNKPNKDSTKAIVRKVSDWKGGCQRGGGNINISTGFLSAFSFENYWICNCDFWIWLLCTFTDRISQTRENDPYCCMQWHQEVIAELITLYF